MDEPVPTRTPDRASPWSNRVQLTVALASLGVAVAYVALRFAYTRFYDALGVAPEDLGLSQVDLLVRSAGLVVLVGATVAVLVVLVGATVAIGLMSVAQVLVFLLQVRQMVLMVKGGPGLHDASSNPVNVWRVFVTSTAKIARWLKVGAAAVTAASVVFVFVEVWGWAAPASQGVQQGKAYRGAPASNTLLPFSLVPWRADPATVRWLRLSPAEDPLSGRCVMYLGQANGIAVLYDVRSQRLVRVPANEVVILVETSADSCRGRT